MKYSIVEQTKVRQVWNVCDDEGNVKWSCDSLQEAYDRVELEQDRRAIEGLYPGNLHLVSHPTGIFIRDDERHVFCVRSRSFATVDDFFTLVRNHPEETFFLLSIKVISDDGNLAYAIRFDTLSGEMIE